MDKIISTLIRVVIAVGVSAGVWVLANLWFDQVRKNWARFSAISHAVVGFGVGILLHGNRALVGFGPDDAEGNSWGDALNLLAWPVIFAVAFSLFGYAIAQVPDRQRLPLATGLGVAAGVGVGLLIADDVRPGLDWVGLIAWTVVIGAIGALVARQLRHDLVGGALVGAALGSVLGGFGLADLGDGSVAEAIVATTVPAALLGARRGLVPTPGLRERAILDSRSRAVIFLGPALLFIFVTLVVPTIRTFYLSFFDRDSEAFVGFDNDTETFTARESLDLSGWADIFSSRAFYIALFILVIAVITAVINKRETGQGVELGGPSMIPIGLGVTFLVMAILSSLRGTIMNNLWWVFTVTLLSTTIGLAVAVLADGRKGESVAKAIIFMPMAVSLVGASIIWRFMYLARDPSNEQTGLLNSLWVGLGKMTTNEGFWFFVVAILIGLALIGSVVALGRAVSRRSITQVPVLLIAVPALAWLMFAFVGPGIGGATTTSTGEVEAAPAFFFQSSPWNNFWLMVILIWIQTGFAMVILSAAIKAVPTEYIEAAKVDGATTSEIFWRITLPTIAPTIGVVVTTLIVLVMKVFDIVKVTTNGTLGTQVLANDMFNQAFSNFNRGRGAALAIILFVSVLPVMYLNIRRMQREA